MTCRYHGAMPMFVLRIFHVICIDVMFVCLSVCMRAPVHMSQHPHAHTAAQVAQAESISELLPTWQEINEGAKRCPAADQALTNKRCVSYFGIFWWPETFLLGPKFAVSWRGGVLGFMWAVPSSLCLRGQCRVHIIILCLQIYVFVIIVENDAAKCFIKGIANRRTRHSQA